MVRIISCILLAFIVLAISCSKADIEPTLDAYSKSERSNIENEIMELVNEYRAFEGLNKVIFDPITYDFAMIHNQYMISQNQISHDNFQQRSSDLSMKVTSGFVSENVAKDFITAEALVRAWKNSPTHKKVMLGDFTHAAVSATPDSTGVFYFTHLFYK